MKLKSHPFVSLLRCKVSQAHEVRWGLHQACHTQSWRVTAQHGQVFSSSNTQLSTPYSPVYTVVEFRAWRVWNCRTRYPVKQVLKIIIATSRCPDQHQLNHRQASKVKLYKSVLCLLLKIEINCFNIIKHILHTAASTHNANVQRLQVLCNQWLQRICIQVVIMLL